MKKNTKEGLVKLLGAIGFIVILVGLAGVYDFWYGVIAAVIIWVLGGVVAKFLGLEKKK